MLIHRETSFAQTYTSEHTGTHAARHIARHLFAISVIVGILSLSACATRTITPSDDSATATPTRAPAPREAPRTATQLQLINEANALMPLASSDIGKLFLRATDSLPAVNTRIAYRDDNTREFFSTAEVQTMAAERQKKLSKIELDEYRYYYTKYGSPLAYLRTLDLAASLGLTDLKGVRILDIGYGSIGHLRLLASLGAYTVGVDPDSYLEALYSQSTDQGAVSPARGLYGGAGGTVTLAHGRWPKDAPIVDTVTSGGPYQLILSKNTLKRGYLKPERRAPKNQLIDLGVPDDIFLRSLREALAPSGLVIIYNLAPKQSSADKPFLPHADARSPFSREQYARAQLDIVAFDKEDNDIVRKMGALLGWDKNDKGEVTNDLTTNLFASYTILRRKP